MAVGVILGVLSMVVALVVAVPAIVGMKLTAEMGRTIGMMVIKEGNLVAVVCVVLGYFLFVIYGKEHCL
ncbi:hypothetical protein Hanom_Chr16g01460841 [Helianthus anomalus]